MAATCWKKALRARSFRSRATSEPVIPSAVCWPRRPPRPRPPQPPKPLPTSPVSPPESQRATNPEEHPMNTAEHPLRFVPNPAQLAKTMRPINQASHTPGYVYGDPAVLALEKERMFMKDWLCMGRIEELPNPGDYMTHTVLGEPVMIARNRAGVLQAFYNQCRHRGVEVAQGRGNAKIFKCPYHAWTYDLD